LACIALMATLIPTASKTYVALTRLHEGQRDALNDLRSLEDIERDFRGVALRTVAILPSFGPYRSAERSIILQTTEATEVFTVDTALRPLRIVFTPHAGVPWEQRYYEYAVPGWAFRFAVGEGGATIECFARREACPERPLRGDAPARFHLLSALPALGGTP
jgi:hypothetical protein